MLNAFLDITWGHVYLYINLHKYLKKYLGHNSGIFEMSLPNFQNAKQPAEDLWCTSAVICDALLKSYIPREGGHNTQ